jgi:hypothetical protein
MQLGAYRINLDALLARMIYRWRVQVLGAVLLLVALAGLLSGTIPPFWNSRATLAIIAAPGATVQVDGRSWPRPVYAGQHTILTTMPDGLRAWSDIELRAGQALTLTLPTGLATPRERSLPAAAPGTHIAQVWWADGTWRVVSIPNPPLETEAEQGQPTPTSAPGQTIAVGRQSVERLTTLDAYAGLADQVHRNSQLLEAVYRSNPSQGFSDQALGTIEVRGWSSVVQTIPISAPVTLLRFAPDGAALLIAERVPSGGEQLFLLRPAQPRVPLVAVPGRIARLSWHPNSTAVVIHSIQGERLTLTVVRLAPTIIAAVIADLDSARYAGAIVPLTWDADGLLWVAPDQQGSSALWSAPLTSLIPERSGDLKARAIWYLPDGTLRVLTVQEESVLLGRYQGDIFIGEATVPRVPAAPDLMGMWHDGELLLQAGDQAWLLDIVEER